MVYSYDKNTKVAMVACTPPLVTSRGSNSFDKDSLRTIGLPWQPYTLGYMDIPWLPRMYGYCTLWQCSLILRASWYKYTSKMQGIIWGEPEWS